MEKDNGRILYPTATQKERKITMKLGELKKYIDRMQNLYYRALLLPIGGGDPRWFSNAELVDHFEIK